MTALRGAIASFRWDSKHPLKPIEYAEWVVPDSSGYLQSGEWHEITDEVSPDIRYLIDSKMRLVQGRVKNAVSILGGFEAFRSGIPNASGTNGMTRQALEKKLADPSKFTAKQVEYLCEASGCTLDYLRCLTSTPTSTTEKCSHERVSQMVTSLNGTEYEKTVSDVIGALALSSRFDSFISRVESLTLDIKAELVKKRIELPDGVLELLDELDLAIAEEIIERHIR